MSIEVDELVKHFRVHQRGSGLRASLHSVLRREHVDVRAVDGVSPRGRLFREVRSTSPSQGRIRP